MSDKVQAKKHLGQHFLKDESVCEKIADSLSYSGYSKILEIGPGMGVLTKYLLKKDIETHVIELDVESVAYLQANYIQLSSRIVAEDFLKFNIKKYFEDAPFSIVGNFPYNISTQIVFRLLENKDQIPEFSGMFQKEVAQRICEKKGTKAYGILSVLVQAFYDAEYLFTVPPTVFDPPPKVDSGVLFLKRKEDYSIPCSEKLFFRVVKAAFNLRRKTLRNSLKVIPLPLELKEDPMLGLRPEQMDVTDFIALTQKIESYARV